MATQKAKFELFSRLQALGFTYDEAVALRRIEMTLHRWDEAECGDGNDYSSWSIERDSSSGKPYRCVYPHNGKMYRYPIADREAGAMRRLQNIVNARNERETADERTLAHEQTGLTYVQAVAACTVVAYHQSDCRGAALYLVRASDIPAGASINSCYNRGLAVAA